MPELDSSLKASRSGRVWIRRIGYVSMTAARYLLALGMFPYAWSKINDLQFQVGASTYAKRLGETSGTSLTWAYLGYEPAFQMLLGFLELVPALLLLWTRTRRIGAVLMFPVLLNVVLVNFFFDLWHDTKVISSIMLGLNIFLLLYDWRLFVGLLRRLISQPVFIERRPLRILAKISATVLPMACLLGFVFFFQRFLNKDLQQTSSDFIGIRQINRAGTWKMTSLIVQGRSVAVDPRTRVYFDFTNQCSIGNGFQFTKGNFKASKFEHTFHIEKIPFDGDSTALDGVYRVDEEHLFLNGQQGNKPVNITLLRDGWGKQFP